MPQRVKTSRVAIKDGFIRSGANEFYPRRDNDRCGYQERSLWQVDHAICSSGIYDLLHILRNSNWAMWLFLSKHKQA